MNDGLFIAVEGIDGSGKSTVCSIFDERRADVEVFSFPRTHRIIGSLADQEHGRLGATLHVADFLDAWSDMQDHLTDGKIVIADRWVDSMIVYGREDFMMDHHCHSLADVVQKPDITVWFDENPHHAADRVDEDEGFLCDIGDGYYHHFANRDDVYRLCIDQDDLDIEDMVERMNTIIDFHTEIQHNDPWL